MMQPPLSLGWVSGKLHNPFVVIADSTGNAVAQGIGHTPEEAMDNARSIVHTINANFAQLKH